MIRTLIVEDEINAQAALRKMLTLINQSIEVIGEAGHVHVAIEQIKTLKPDLVFMDVMLEDGTSFDILDAFEEIDFKIIFTTAYNEYAINAFKFSAVDYLLKPIDPIELKDAIQRAVSSILMQKEHQKLLDVLKDNLASKERKIVLKTTEQRFIILIKDIIHLEASGAYTTFFTTTQKIVVSKNIKYYQGLLDKRFVRCHQSHLVNIKHIHSLYRGSLKMSNETLVPISTRKKAEILQLIQDVED